MVATESTYHKSLARILYLMLDAHYRTSPDVILGETYCCARSEALFAFHIRVSALCYARSRYPCFHPIRQIHNKEILQSQILFQSISVPGDLTSRYTRHHLTSRPYYFPIPFPPLYTITFNQVWLAQSLPCTPKRRYNNRNQNHIGSIHHHPCRRLLRHRLRQLRVRFRLHRHNRAFL
jgi:hypothetical protein